MSISVKCQCGMTFQAKPELAGKRVKCGSCKAPILIPQSGQSTGPPPSSTSEVFVACQCGQQFKVATQYAGQQVNCPKCQVSLTVPGGASPPSPSTGFPVLDGGGNPKTRQPQAPIPNQSGFSPPASRDVPAPPKLSQSNFKSGDSCPFPGMLIELLLPLFKDRSDPNKERFTQLHYQLFGIGYCVFAGSIFLNTVITLFRSNPPLDQAVFTLLGILAAMILLVGLHFATHWALSLSPSIMKNPMYSISSERHLHIMATPLMLTGIGVAIYGFLGLYEGFKGSSDSSVILTAGLSIGGGLALIVLTLRSVLNPAQVGVREDSSATFAETILGMSAVFSRAPLYSAQLIYPISLGILAIGSVLALFIQLTANPILIVAVLSLVSVGAVGTLFPIIAYVIAFSGMLTIELLQAIFEIRRNTKSSK